MAEHHAGGWCGKRHIRGGRSDLKQLDSWGCHSCARTLHLGHGSDWVPGGFQHLALLQRF